MDVKQIILQKSDFKRILNANIRSLLNCKSFCKDIIRFEIIESEKQPVARFFFIKN